MARLPVEVLNLLSDGDSALRLAIAEASRVQGEFDYTLLPSSFGDELRLHVEVTLTQVDSSTHWLLRETSGGDFIRS